MSEQYSLSQSERKQQICKITHICSKPEILPNEFFSKSIFGESLIGTCSIHETTPSDLKVQNFRATGFPEHFCYALEHGLPLLLGANPPARMVPNYISATSEENREFLQTTLNKWEAMGILRFVECKPHIVNPLSVVVSGSKKRLVMDARSSGLNDHIIAPKFILPNIGEIIQTLRKEDFMAKLDLANGFLQLPIRKNEQTFLGLRNPLDGRYAVLQRLPFGLRSAPFLFSSFTNAIRQATQQLLNIQTQVYIDDWFIANRTLADATKDLKTLSDFLTFLGISIQHEKTEGPAQALTYLGLVIDTSNLEIRLTEQKRVKYVQGISELLTSESPTMAQIAKTAGRMVHIAFVHRAGAAFIQPLWEILYRERQVWTKAQLEREGILIDEELTECLEWWKEVLSVPNICRRIWTTPTGNLFLWTQHTTVDAMEQVQTICTDASNEGWGASTKVLTISGIWSNRQQRTSSNWKELKTVNLAISSWDFLRNIPILVLSDSSTVVAALRKRSSKTAALQSLIKELTDLEAVRKIEVVAFHLPGALNDLPDRLSRGRDTKVASMLSFDRECAPSCIRDIGQLHGMTWKQTKFDARLFGRREQLFVEPQACLFAISTPDIPYLKEKWKQLENHSNRVFILIPKIPSSELPLNNTIEIPNTSEIRCINIPHIEWTLLEVIRNGGTSAKTVTRT